MSDGQKITSSGKASNFLSLVWCQQLGRVADNASVEIINRGTINTAPGPELTDVCVRLDGQMLHGMAAVHEYASDWHKHLHHIDSRYDHCALHIVRYSDVTICRTDGSVVPTVVVECPDSLVMRYNRLIEQSATGGCGATLAAMEQIERHDMLTWLTIERLERKYNDFLARYEASSNNWNEAFYLTLFRTLGAGTNREPYKKLAHLVPYTYICHVRENTFAVEALLLGSAGLLQSEYPDDYTLRLQQEFEHQRRRFGIYPMRRNEWLTTRHNPNHLPVLRLAELASLLASQEFMFSRLIECRTLAEARKILSVQASEYWTTHYALGNRTTYSVKGFGDMMIHNLCINLVAPMMFTYGHVSQNDELKERAIDLLEQIPAENNLYIRNWQASGLAVENAFFSQGVLQLAKEYCEKKRCAECNIGKFVLCSQ